MPKNKFEVLEKEYPDTLILQLRGSFYNAFNDGAVVLSELMDYRLKETSSGYKCGFPVAGLDKVEEKLKRFHVNFVIFDGDKKVSNKRYEDNQFLDFLRLYSKGEEESIPDRKRTIQKTMSLESGGSNESEAVNELRKMIETEVLEKDYKIITSYFKDRKVGKMFLISGFVVYEEEVG